MVQQPTRGRIQSNPHDLTDVQPAEQNVQIRSARSKAVPTVDQFRLADPPKEEKAIADTDSLPGQMALCRTRLAERRQPPLPSILRGPFEVRIDVGRLIRSHPTKCEVRNDLADVEGSGPQVPEFRSHAPPISLWNGERKHLAIRKNRARATPIRRIEPLSAQDQLHRCRRASLACCRHPAFGIAGSSDPITLEDSN